MLLLLWTLGTGILMLLDTLRQWPVLRYSSFNLLEIEVLATGEYQYGQLHAALSIGLPPLVTLLPNRRPLLIGHDPTLVDIRGNLGSKMGLIRKCANNRFCELEFKNQ